MIRTLGFQDNFYLVICADIECMILANSFEEAATNGLNDPFVKIVCDLLIRLTSGNQDSSKFK